MWDISGKVPGCSNQHAFYNQECIFCTRFKGIIQDIHTMTSSDRWLKIDAYLK